MVRAFSDEPVDAAALERVLHTAQRGPSAGYSQGVEFVIVTEEPDKLQLARLVTNRESAADAIARAPVHVVICASADIYKERYREPDKLRVRGSAGDDALWQIPFWHVDAGAAMMLVLLSAVNEGLDAGFIGVWRQPEVRTLLGIPESYSITGIAMLGHRARAEQAQGSVISRRRRAAADVIHRERW